MNKPKKIYLIIREYCPSETDTVIWDKYVAYVFLKKKLAQAKLKELIKSSQANKEYWTLEEAPIEDVEDKKQLN